MGTSQPRGLRLLLSGLSLVLLAGVGGAAHAQISGFNGFTANSNTSTLPTVTASDLTITDGANSEARSSFSPTKQDITNWTSSFVYTASGNKQADGITLAFQNQGTTALGGSGGALGYNGITGNSAAVQLNIYSGAAGGVGSAFGTNGTIATNAATGSVNLASGDPIGVGLSYSGTTLSETLTDLTTLSTYSTSYTTNLASVLGTTTAYVGFTGGTGGLNATQVISGFSFSKPLTSATVPGDPISIYANTAITGTGTASSSPAAEDVTHAIDGTTSKYLNFYGAGSGFVVTPAAGAKAINALRFVAANDGTERDPTSFTLEGSNNGGTTYTTIVASQAINLSTVRNAGADSNVLATNNDLEFFNNTTAYSTYRVSFPTLRNQATANSMQIGEVQLLVGTSSAAPEPGSVAFALSALLPIGGLALRRRRNG